MTLFLAFLFACQTETPVSAPTPPPAAAPSTHDATPHEHEAPHGGVVQVVGDKHVEALMMPDGILLWLTDGAGAALPVEAWQATLVVQGPTGVVTVSASPMGDHLHAQTKLEQGKPANLVLTLTKDGKAESASFSTESVGMKSHDHTSLHGGVVAMRGNWHIEYAPKDGELRFWLSGEHREAITEAVSGTAKDGDQVLPLGYDPATALLSAKAEGAGTRPVTLDMKIGETTVSLDFEPVGH